MKKPIKYLPNLYVCLTIFVSLFAVASFIYALFRFGLSLHHDEWVGRGLYPGLAMGHGFDLYEPKTGPHVTLYGFGVALFYSLTSVCTTPNQAIWLAFVLNVIGFSLPTAFLLNQSLKNYILEIKTRVWTIIGIIILLISIFSTEPTTEGILRIHADMPALFYLLASVCFFLKYNSSQKKIFLIFTAVALCFSIWAKVTTIHAILYPLSSLLFQKRYVDALTYIPVIILSLITTFSIFTIFYGWNDTTFILFKHITSGTWSIRNSLFDGTNAKLAKMNYIEAIPLMFRFFVMYLAEYWYIFSCCLGSLVLLINKAKNNSTDNIKLLTINYFLLSPAGLVALAHFGSVENSLLFVNSCGIMVILFSIIIILREKISPKLFVFSIWSFALIFSLPFLRLSKGGKESSNDAPYNQAYEYLEKGNEDVYFGWYPIAHLFHSGDNYSCIETPIWVGMTRPKEIDYSIDHFPKNAKYIATCPTGYGSIMLEQYLGELEEINAPHELSSWRLFKIKDTIER